MYNYVYNSIYIIVVSGIYAFDWLRSRMLSNHGTFCGPGAITGENNKYLAHADAQ